MNKASGMGFTGWLTIAFIVLKLTGYIEWSWVWVLSPLWIGAILIVVLVVILLRSRYGGNHERHRPGGTGTGRGHYG